MPHRPSATDLSADALTRALRDLPPAAPPVEGWSTLAASLRTHGLVRDEGDDASADDGMAPGRIATGHEMPRLQDRRRHARGMRRLWLGAGVAAALALAAVTLAPTTTIERTADGPAVRPDHATAGTPPPVDDLAALRGESSRIEEWLRTLKADETPLDGRSLMAATEIEDMIGLIDLQLAAGNDASNDTRTLWRERVELLRDLATVRTTYSLAGTGIAANGAAAMPNDWTHL